MQVTIEFTTGSFYYQVLKGNADFDECFEDNEKVQDLVERLHNSTTYEEREEIADQLWEECEYDPLLLISAQTPFPDLETSASSRIVNTQRFWNDWQFSTWRPMGKC